MRRAAEWTDAEIGQWFIENLPHFGLKQGCDGLDLPDTEGGYVWFEAFVDHDLHFFALLDVRTDDAQGIEHRDHLYVGWGISCALDVEWRGTPVRWLDDTRERSALDLHWFAACIERFFDQRYPA